MKILTTSAVVLMGFQFDDDASGILARYGLKPLVSRMIDILGKHIAGLAVAHKRIRVVRSHENDDDWALCVVVGVHIDPRDRFDLSLAIGNALADFLESSHPLAKSPLWTRVTYSVDVV